MDRDPILYDGGDNQYAYVNGNPIKSIDPSGLGLEIIEDCVEGGCEAAAGEALAGLVGLYKVIRDHCTAGDTSEKGDTMFCMDRYERERAICNKYRGSIKGQCIAIAKQRQENCLRISPDSYPPPWVPPDGVH